MVRRALKRPPPKRAVYATAVGDARIAGIDTLRGIAIVAMIVYHFCFDLRYFGLARWDFEHDTRWIAARTTILSSFLLLAGISSVLAARRPIAHRLLRIALIALAAALVSAASAILFPASFIWFGVLHAIVVASLVALPFVGHPAVAAIAGIGVIVAGVTLSDPAFDARTLGWIGFMTHKPATEDYVPLFPWAGVVLGGVTVGHALAASPSRTDALLAPLARLPATLRWLGRNSLMIYLVHQPLMLGALWLANL